MSLNLSIDLGLAIEQLRSSFGGASPSLQLSELFTQTLGWDLPQRTTKKVRYLNQQCVPIAERESVMVWHVPLAAKTRFAPALRHQLYTALQGDLPVAPLVIFSAADGRRSLWCQSANESALYVPGAPTMLWRYRLRRLARGTQGLFPTISTDDGSEIFFELLECLSHGTTGIESTSARRLHSVLTLQRLMLIQQVQQQGWLAGDTWYLQVRFGEALQRGENLFFKTCLQPLYRSLSLPTVERPLALQKNVGEVPFLGQLFHTHWVEEKYASIEIADEAFEKVLGWLSEQTSAGTLDPWMAGETGYWMGQYWQRRSGGMDGMVCTPAMAREVCDRTLDQWLLNRLDVFESFRSISKKKSKQKTGADDELVGAAQSPQTKTPQTKTLNDSLFIADSQMCRRLIQEILPELKILDPHCGSAQLLSAFHQRLTEIFSILTGYIQQTQDAQLKIWHSTLVDSDEIRREGVPGQVSIDAFDNSEETTVVLKNIQERILKNNLYGVAQTPEVAISARFQLLSHLVAAAQAVESIEPLVDLEFNVMSGNAVVGFISVDEERFDQVNKAGADSILQGDLLQPLAADSYQTILSEKNIALEHYQSRSQLLATTHNVPAYARAALLREDILTLDSRAQHKLDTLLLSHMSQQLGIRYREMQLTDKPKRRPLTLGDVAQASAFHWGYHFSAIVKRGGFDVVACIPSWGAFKPTVAEFVSEYEDLATRVAIEEKTFKTSKQSLAKEDPAVAKAWFAYQDQYAFFIDYFTRSDLYAYQSVSECGKRNRKPIMRESLFVERCSNLLSADGLGAVFLHQEGLGEEGNGLAIGELFDQQAKDVELIGSETILLVWQKC
ncbi:MAG: hypothetical protein AAF810_08425 [Cyanobacteria bacterium P01_D01_bin.36]